MKSKKVIAILMSMCMVSGLAACGNSSLEAKSDETGSTAEGETAAGETENTDGEEDAADSADGEVRDVSLTVWGPQEDQSAVDGYDAGILAAMCDDFNEAHPEWNITFEYGVCGEDGDLHCSDYYILPVLPEIYY